MLDSPRDKNEGAHRSKEGGGRRACYVTPDLRYERGELEKSGEDNGWDENIYLSKQSRSRLLKVDFTTGSKVSSSGLVVRIGVFFCWRAILYDTCSVTSKTLLVLLHPHPRDA